jgi:hypothetical protein
MPVGPVEFRVMYVVVQVKLNMELELQSLFGILCNCTVVLIG